MTSVIESNNVFQLNLRELSLMRKQTSQELMRRGKSAELAIQMVLDGLTSQHSKRAYGRQLRDFINWFATNGESAMSKAVVQRYASELRDAGRSSATSQPQDLSAIWR
jgi:site-specific recombinase XerD